MSRIPGADAFAAALAKKHKAELATGDPQFKAVEEGNQNPLAGLSRACLNPSTRGSNQMKTQTVL